VGFDLRPNLRASDFLIALFATIFGAETEHSDFDVAARKLDIALRELTRLLKLKSELRERVSLARSTVEKASGKATQARADRKIFEEKHRRPAAKHVLFILPVTSEAQKRHDAQLARMQGFEEAAFAKLKEEKTSAGQLAQQLEEVTAEYAKAEKERNQLSELVARTALLRMLSALASGNADALEKTFNQARERTRADRRLLLMRVFAEAVLANPHQAFGLLRELKETFGPETGAPYRLMRSLLDFINGSELTSSELGAFTEGNFTYAEEYALYRFLQVANGIVPEGLAETPEEGSLGELLAFVRKWRSGEAGALTLKVKEWERQPLRTEFALIAHLAREEYAQALAVLGLDLVELEAKLLQRRRELSVVQSYFMRLAEQRTLTSPIFAPNLERIFCLFLIALKEVALPQTFEVAREILRPAKCGNLHSWYRWRTVGEKPALGYRRDPEDPYWPPEETAQQEQES